MVNVFTGSQYSIQYQQISEDLGIYHTFANESIELLKPQVGTKVLDLCCGTGNSTCALFAYQPNITVTGIDSSREFLDLAEIKLD
ncbi:MAG: methyltransferase domain-containing protein, partial [archaeon]|nr:methyltransferase domain-containing protein [archaeon]